MRITTNTDVYHSIAEMPIRTGTFKSILFPRLNNHQCKILLERGNEIWIKFLTGPATGIEHACQVSDVEINRNEKE